MGPERLSAPLRSVGSTWAYLSSWGKESSFPAQFFKKLAQEFLPQALTRIVGTPYRPKSQHR